MHRFKTDKGAFYLKKVPSALFVETAVIQLLQVDFHNDVPTLIDINRDEHSFLMDDRGMQLHEYFQTGFDAQILINVIHDYTAIQLSSLSMIDDFLAVGVPDWRLEKLPQLYDELIERGDLLLEDGLTRDELNQLKKQSPEFNAICDQLAQYRITNTFGHADFHPKNILIDQSTRRTTIIDLGEVVITHPFFSLNNCLHMAKENFSLSESQYNLLLNACLEPWLSLESLKNLASIYSIIQRCWSIHAVLGELRLMDSVNKADFKKLHREGRLSNKLRFWINSKSYFK